MNYMIQFGQTGANSLKGFCLFIAKVNRNKIFTNQFGYRDYWIILQLITFYFISFCPYQYSTFYFFVLFFFKVNFFFTILSTYKMPYIHTNEDAQ